MLRLKDYMRSMINLHFDSGNSSPHARFAGISCPKSLYANMITLSYTTLFQMCTQSNIRKRVKRMNFLTPGHSFSPLCSPFLSINKMFVNQSQCGLHLINERFLLFCGDGTVALISGKILFQLSDFFL